MLLAAALAWAMLCAWAAVFRATEAGDMVLWRRVLVNSSWVKGRNSHIEKSLPLTLCGTACLRDDLCHLWCHIQPRECLLTALIVSGSYQPSQENNTLSCYTSRQPEFAAGASITHSRFHNSNRPPANLVDGVFRSKSIDLAACQSQSGVNAWFLVDLGVTRLISEVLVMTAYHGSSRLQSFDVKVGDLQEDGDFSSYMLLGSYNETVVTVHEIVLRPPAPIAGRYVSIQKLDGTSLVIAHLEIR